MKFRVIRTSQWGNEKPCEEAVKCKATFLDVRAVKTIEEAKKHEWFEEWFNSTVNHREENGCIVGERKVKNDIWVVELNTLEDLMNFIRKYGDVVIYEFCFKEYPYTIEIYDYYRE